MKAGVMNKLEMGAGGMNELEVHYGNPKVVATRWGVAVQETPEIAVQGRHVQGTPGGHPESRH